MKKPKQASIIRPLGVSLGRFTSALACCAALMAGAGKAEAGTFYWDTDGSTVGNNIDGTGLGGSGTWDTIGSRWWPDPAGPLTVWPNTNTDIAIFSAPFALFPTQFSVAIGTAITANQLSFIRSGYTVSGGTLTLAGMAPGVRVNLGETATISSLIAGSDGFNKTGLGALRLTAANTYTGSTVISNGAVIITNESALGLDTSEIIVDGFDNRGFGGGALVLEGGATSGVNITRNIRLRGYGPIADRSVALLSYQTNTISGNVTTGTRLVSGGTDEPARIGSVVGRLTFAGGFDLGATTILGGVNSASEGGFEITGVLSSNGVRLLEKQGSGTLILNPSSSALFSGTVRVSSLGTIRIVADNVLGTRTATGTGSVLDLNGGTLEVRMDAPALTVGGAPALAYLRATSTIFVDHSVGGTTLNGTATFGPLNFEEARTLTFNGRNGYGVTIGPATVNGGTNNSTFNNNSSGLLTFTGNFWNNPDNTGNRTMTIGGTGDTLIAGSIIASAPGRNHSLTATGGGTLTITGTASTLDGDVRINGGTLAITDFRSITNNTGNVNIGTGGTTGTLTLGVAGTSPTAGGLTTNLVINLAGTTGGAVINANQTGANPVIFNANFMATGGSATQNKTLVLGGTNTAGNLVNAIIPNNDAGGLVNLRKDGAGTWALGKSNTYTGSTTITGGTLRLNANAAASTIVSDSSAIIFTQVSQNAGGTLEFMGQAGVSNVETLGTLTPTNGSGTIKLTPGAGGTASLVFSTLGAFGAGGTVNIVAPTSSNTVKFATYGLSNNIANAGLYYNGSDFAFVPGAGLAVRAPIYGTDPDFVTSATALATGANNEITGSFITGIAFTIDSLKINGSHTLTTSGLLTIRTAGGTSASGGIIQTGGSGSISGVGISTGTGTNSTGAIVIRVEGEANSLTLNAPVTATTRGGITKSGAGTLVIAGLNAQAGAFSINEGTVQLSGSGRLSANNQVLTIRQDGKLDLNGVSTGAAIGQFNNNGIVTNSNATPATLQIGNNNQAGTSLGIIENGAGGAVSVIKVGNGNQTWSGLSTYTGTTTIGGTGIVSIAAIASTGSPSSIGAGELVFDGTSATQDYGAISYTGRTSVSINRLFTFNGGANGGARILNNSANDSALVFDNSGALIFGAPATGNPQGLVLGGSSDGDNLFNPLIANNGGAITSVFKTDPGLWILGNAANSYTGPTTISGGILRAQSGTTLPTASNLVLAGGVLSSTGSFTRPIGTGSGQFQFAGGAANGGFAAGSSKLTVNWGSTPGWGSTSGFLDRGALLLGSATGLAEVDIASGINLGTASAASAVLTASRTSGNPTLTLTSGDTTGLSVGQFVSGTGIRGGSYIISIDSPTTITLSQTASSTATSGAITIDASSLRAILVEDNTNTQTNFATITGVISGSSPGTGVFKGGPGVLQLFGANTYSGNTTLAQGELVVKSLGNSSVPGSSSVGTTTGANLASNAVILGNGSTGPGNLQYVGTGEISDRMIRLNTTTGSTQIHADGTGPIVLTNLVNDMAAGAKTLFLRGSNTSGNMITSQLSDNGGDLRITVDGGAVWILTNPANNYSGLTAVNAGALGLGSNTALGTGPMQISNASVFAYGADLTITNELRHANNTGAAFIGDYSMNFVGNYTLLAAANNPSTTTNNIITGKTLTFGNVTADLITAARTWTINGGGDTVIGGSISSSTIFDLNIIYSGTGSLTLGGANTYTGSTEIRDGRLILAGGSNNHLPVSTALSLGFGTAAAATSGIIQLGDVTGPSNQKITSLTVTGSGLSNAIVGGNAAVSTLNVDYSDILNPILVQLTLGGDNPNENNLKLVKTGPGTMTLNTTGRQNSYIGGTDVGTPGGVDGGILALDGFGTILGNVVTPAPVTVYGGTLDIGFTSQEISNLGLGGGSASSTSKVIINGDLTINGNITYSALNNPNPATISGDGAINLSPVGVDTTVTVGSSTAGSGGALSPDLTISAALIGSTDLRKAGPGTLRLVFNPNTTFTGSLLLDAGTLIIDGTATNPVVPPSSSFTVKGGTTLNLGPAEGEKIFLNTLTLQDKSKLVFNLGAVGSHDNLDVLSLMLVPDPMTATMITTVDINALDGFGFGTYPLLLEDGVNLNTNNPFRLGSTPGGFSYTLRTDGTGPYELFLDVAALSTSFYWKGAVNNLWSAASPGNWVDAASMGVAINGIPGLVNDVFFSAASPLNQMNTVVNVNMGAKRLEISDALVASIKGVSGTVLSIGDGGIVISGSVGAVALGSSTPAEALNLGIPTTQSWANNGTGTLTIWNQIFGQGDMGTQTLTFSGSSPSIVNGNIIDGGFGGKVGIAKSGGTLTLTSPANSYTGGTKILAGTLEFASGALPTIGSVEFVASGTLKWLPGNTNDISNRLKIADGVNATLDTNGNNVVFANTLQSGAGTTGILTKTGLGTLKLSGNNLIDGYSGGTNIQMGTFEFFSRAIVTRDPDTGAILSKTLLSGLPAVGDVTFIGDSTLKWSPGDPSEPEEIPLRDVSSRARILNGVNATMDTGGNNVFFNDAAILNGTSSTGTLTKDGAGTLALNQPITIGSGYTGGTRIKGGTLEFVPNALPATGEIRFTGNSTLRWGGANTTDVSSRLKIDSGVTATIDTSSNNVIFATALNSGGPATSGSLKKLGSGTLTVAAANTLYTGATMVNEGTVVVSGSISGSTSVNVASGATLQFAGAANRILDSAPVTMGGGAAGIPATLEANGLGETVGQFTLAGDSVIDFGDSIGTVQLKFGASAGIPWTGTLSIHNWSGVEGVTGGMDQLFFGTSSAGLDALQLARVRFFADDGITLLGPGVSLTSIGELIPVPEPGSVASLVGGFSLLLGLRRRRPGRRMSAGR